MRERSIGVAVMCCVCVCLAMMWFVPRPHPTQETTHERLIDAMTLTYVNTESKIETPINFVK